MKSISRVKITFYLEWNPAMLRTLNARLLRPLWAMKQGNPLYRHLHLLERRQFDSPETIQHRTWELVQAQLRHAWETVPFYRTHWQRAGLHPNDIRTIADLQHLPIVTKDHIRKELTSLRSIRTDLGTIHWKTTSGSTGVPLKVAIDEPALRWKQACTLRSDQWSGYQVGDRVAKVWGNPEYRHFGWKGRLVNHFIDRAVYLDTLHVNDQRLHAFAKDLTRKQPGLLFGHAHSLYLLAVFCKKHHYHVRPGGIISAAMMLHHWQKQLMEQVFQTPVTNRYGCEEVSLIASECEAHRGLHINSDSVHLEFADDTRFPNGKSLLVTDLVNRAMPLIRYQVGDVVVPSSRTCSCGRGLPMLEELFGREADYVLSPTGELISGISLTENFAMHIPGAAQIQLVQDLPTHLQVRLVPGEEYGPASAKKIGELVRATFGPAMTYDVELLDSLPQEKSGKYRFCISPVAQRYLQELAA
ncbi:MAG: phenylacetate--CoA ligase family protein [Zavarzinella sp.]